MVERNRTGVNKLLPARSCLGNRRLTFPGRPPSIGIPQTKSVPPGSPMKLVPAGFLVLWLCLVADAPSSAQTGASAPLPTHPVAFMILAHDKNGLNSADVKPWHIRGSYTIYDKNGKPADTGVYEAWWVAPDRYVRSFAGSRFQQTEYATDKGLFRKGQQKWAGSDYVDMRASLVEPIV